MKDAKGNLTIEDVLQTSMEFQKTDGDFGIDSSTFWLKIRIPEAGVGRVLVLENAYLDEVHAYFENKESRLHDFGKMNYQTAFNDRNVPYHHFAFRAPAEGGTFFIRINRHFLKVVAPIRIFKEKEFDEFRIQKDTIHALFSGAILCLSVLSFILFLVNGQRLYLFYGIYLITVLFSVLLTEGYLVENFARFPYLVSTYHWRNIFNNLATLFLLFFIHAFILKDSPRPRLTNSLTKIGGFAITIPIFLLLLEKNHPQYTQFFLWWPHTGYFICVVVSFSLVLYSLVKKIQPMAASFFLIGITPVFLYTVLSAFRNIGMFPDYNWLSYRVRLSCILFDMMFIFIGIAYQIRRLQIEKNKQEKLAYEAEIKLYRERERIGKELHDNVGSQLTIVSSGLDYATYLAEKKVLKPEKLDELADQLRGSIQSLRDAVWASSKENVPEEELVQRIHRLLLKAVGERIELDFLYEGAVHEIRSEKALEIFRIIQECVNNTLKHAKASIIICHINSDEKQLSIQYKDNGHGFDPSQKDKTESFGLKNMTKRALQIDAKLAVNSTFGAGMTMTLVIDI